jgi:hypothetical protein
MRYEAWYPIVDAQRQAQRREQQQRARWLAHRRSGALLQRIRRWFGNLIERARLVVARYT